MSMQTAATPPVHKVQYGAITVSIWENASADGRTFFSYTLSRSYCDDDGNWHDVSSFQSRHTKHLENALNDTWLWIETIGRERQRSSASV